MKPWEGVVKIPEGESGSHRISHFTRPPGEVERSNLRTACIGGQHAEPIIFDRETTWHALSYEGGTWMTDLPIEQEQHDLALEPVYGSVLVGGLGVGYAANTLAARDDVDRVVVVELSSDVVKLVKPHIIDPHGKVEVLNVDLFDYLKRDIDEEFDYAFFDIWQSDGEGTFFNVVCPLRKLTWDWVNDSNIICWNENVMRGQLLNNLQSRALFAANREHFGKVSDALPTLEDLATPSDSIWRQWSVPFFKALLDGRVPSPTDDHEEFMGWAGSYAGMYGTREWETYWELTLKGR